MRLCGKLILMDALLEIDRQLFLFINHLPDINELKFVTPFLDGLMVFFSAVGSGAIIWLVLGTMMAWQEKKRDLKAIIDFLWPLFLSLALSGIFASLILKPFVGRVRPNFVIPEARVLGRVLNDFSFPSGHATSSFAAAYVLGERMKRRGLAIRKMSAIVDCFRMAKGRGLRLSLYSLATLISFSRVYLGVHYPLDVVVGAVLGVVIGKVTFFIDERITN